MAAAELWCKYELYAFSKSFESYLHFQIAFTFQCTLNGTLKFSGLKDCKSIDIFQIQLVVYIQEPMLSDINRSYNKRNEALRDSLLSSVLVLWPIMQNGFLT